MRELERTSPLSPPARPRCAIVGAGRLGHALTSSLREAGYEVTGPQGRGADGGEAEVVILCVPDGEIAAAARAVGPRAGRLVAHCSGATGLGVLAPHEAFSLHPLMTVPSGDARLTGAGCAIDATTPVALRTATQLAEELGMRPVRIGEGDRVAYHAAASIASNFLVTLEGAAETLMRTAGGDRELLAPLVRAAVENWVAAGPERALTGPIARGDHGTVARQRAAVAERAPELLDLWDSLAAATGALASREAVAA